MTRQRTILIAVIVVVAVLAGIWWVTRGGQAPPVVDFAAKFSEALKQPVDPAGDRFSVKDETIGGKTLHAIYARPESRLTWTVTVPNDAWLRTSLGIDEQAWDKDGDGVLFFIAIADGKNFDQILTQHVDPHAARGDRRWVPVTLDLSAYGGRTVKIMFNTRSSQPGKPADPRNDFAYWGAPAITLRP